MYSSGYGHHARSRSREASTEHSPIPLRAPQVAHPCQPSRAALRPPSPRRRARSEMLRVGLDERGR
eukprot:1247884-Prymnesium_polylepis.1